jgi:prepilin-type N-terminal cleavage/methylation domain-containing protein
VRPRTDERGFTLIELTAVVAVVVMLYALVLPNLGLGSRRALDGEAEVLRADLELARQRAIATGTPHRLAIDLDLDRVHLERFEPAPPPSAEARDPREPVDLSPPRPAEGRFEPLPTRQGRGRRLDEEVFVASIETPEGPVNHGIVGLGFFQDGSATPARIRLANADGDALELELLPLADMVRIHVVE